MRVTALFVAVSVAALSGCASSRQPSESRSFNVEEIRAAERALVAALEAPDPTAWVYHYTEDAVLVEPDAEPIAGRQALLDMAKNMKPLSSVVLSPVRTEGDGNLAYVYGSASWVNGRPPDVGSASNVRLVMVWRREADGAWRVVQEVFAPVGDAN